MALASEITADETWGSIRNKLNSLVNRRHMLSAIPANEWEGIVLGSGNYDAASDMSSMIADTVGVIDLPSGVLRTGSPVFVATNNGLRGQGMSATYIKPLDDAAFSEGQAVFMTEGFTADANLWNYYTPYPPGIDMGVSLLSLCIDGNRANVANASGLMVYGGKFRFDQLAVISTAGHGIVTECGVPGSSTIGDDLDDFLNMHEAPCGVVYLCNNDKRGWWWRGPNDSFVQEVQVKASGWSGFFVDSNNETTAAPTLKIGKLHAYVTNHAADDPDGFMIKLADGAEADFVYVDTPYKNGLVLDGSDCQIGRVRVFKAGQHSLSESSHVAVEVAGENNSILSLKSISTARTTPYGGIVKVSGTDCAVLDAVIKESSSSTTDILPVLVSGNGAKVRAKIKGAANVTLAAKLDASRSDVEFEALDCGAANIRYENAGRSRNRIVSVISGTSTGGYTQAQTVALTDRLEVTSASRSRQIIRVNDFGDRSLASFSSGVLTFTSSNDVYESAGVTVTSIVNNIAQNLLAILTNTGTGSITFSHNGTSLQCPGGVDLVLAPGEAIQINMSSTVATIIR